MSEPEKDQLQTRIPAGEPGWWWASSVDSECWSGPFKTDAEARADWFEKEGRFDLEQMIKAGEFGGDNPPTPQEFADQHEAVDCFRIGAISTAVFDAESVLEQLEEHNEEVVWADNPPNFSGYDRDLLERMLADALARWLVSQNAKREFRGLVSA